jgi:hypothetical protein
VKGREGRGVLVYLLLDVATDDDATDLTETLAKVMGEADGRFVGYALSQVEPVELTFEGEEDGGEGGLPAARRRPG